ncbi:YgdI/YgdR family lipoprotein [Atopomonas sediminilitoris]|uniref:YgdI/YgdR family lipoprotein n=1 Tax=Atopomonas sediminilitoris TaxID=2919919 RepID=UPI001F4DB8A0|nr:YgdI/YgdR family lipoprotein [Atopomonas sediminilitoris]MCJ8170740.1 YgdI/YgdR family lipoprotein [Atopomonas sediminilitoris]
MRPLLALTALIAASTVLVGCSSPYVMTTKDGTAIMTQGKPKLDADAGVYKYEDSEGREGQVRAEQVNQVMQCGD